MEIVMKMKYKSVKVCLVMISVVLQFLACSPTKESNTCLPFIRPAKEYVLLSLTPEFSIKAKDLAINNQYLTLINGKQFPMLGFLRVNDKLYRFMGGETLRNRPIFPLSTDSCGWVGKYTYLYPQKGWEQEQYDDSKWEEGVGAFGSDAGYYPVYTAWSVNNIYVRRNIYIDDINKLKDKKLYIHYLCDDHINLFCNGKHVLEDNYTPDIRTKPLNENIADLLHNGNNVIAAQGINDGGGAVLDFGLYVENEIYNKADTAILKEMDMQTTRTHYVFQCGDVKLMLDFVSPALTDNPDFIGYPAGIISYKIETENKNADIEIKFDFDAGSLYNKHGMYSSINDEWRVNRINNSIYIGMKADETSCLQKDGHMLMSQRLYQDSINSGLLIMSYKESNEIQYKGEHLHPYWSRDGKSMEEIIKIIGDFNQELIMNCKELDYQCYERGMRMKGKKFVEKTILNYREFWAKHRFVTSPNNNNELFCFEHSLGNVNLAYEYYPTLLFYNRIDCMKGLLNPIFDYCESSDWVKKYPSYDMGNFPIVNRQINTEDRGAEIAADMLIMTLAIVKEEKKFDYAEKHWKVLCQWADYLKDHMADDYNFSFEFPSANDERIVLGWSAYQTLLHYN